MARYPQARWMPVSSHGGPIGTVLGVVFHVTAGEGDPYNEFANPTNKVSSHFGIGNGQGGMTDGAIEQYVDTSERSWAQAAGNANYLSVETEGVPGEPLTSAQVASFGALMVWANQVHGVPLVSVDTPGQRGLILHGDGGKAWGNHLGCPGTLRAAQRADILAAAHQPTNPPTHQEQPTMFCTDPETGGTWSTDADGELFAEFGAPFVQGLNQHPDYHAGGTESGGKNPCVGIAATKVGGEWGLVYFTFDWTKDKDGSPYHKYRFARNGTPS